jgi:hypothetical protein
MFSNFGNSGGNFGGSNGGNFDIHTWLNNNIGDEFKDVASIDEGSNVFNDKTNDKTDDTPNTQIINYDVVLGIDNLKEFKLLLNPKSLWVYRYLCVFSDWRNKTEELPTGITRFTWNYAPTQNIQMGFCNSIGEIKNAIAMRLYQPRIPYVNTMNTNAKRVSLLIEEFSAQSFSAENGRRFHFILRPNTFTGPNVELSVEDLNDGIYTFKRPITEFNTLSISFGNPLNIITFVEPFDPFFITLEFVCFNI